MPKHCRIKAARLYCRASMLAKGAHFERFFYFSRKRSRAVSKEHFILGLVTLFVTLLIAGMVGVWTISVFINEGQSRTDKAIHKVKVDLNQSINKVRVDMTQSFGEVRGDIRVLGTSVGGLEADVKDLKTDVKGLQTDVKDLQTDVQGKVKVNSLEDDMRDNNEYLRERKIQSVPNDASINDASINDASISETPIPKEDMVKLRKISAENKP